ncbi:DUF2442 domain-containing protein [Chelativorans sp. ZYF759]|uniref:DUF2442 domain-containing protein n=1 Tax=Chelativorans sp. ZYF759 TaxID=2692213 RepID=UPI00145E2EB2|nr:DUF2442 domain-containing protein [Chelativorans sp. ZYF759]NMG40566.1 DUF2442 domain-containing protein [Chelativorans sp. ZYF759]
MSFTRDADEDRTAAVVPPINPAAPWRVVAVVVVGDTDLKVRFVDGVEGLVHMHDLIWSERPGVFAALRDPDVFRRAHLQLGAVTWPGEIDLAPDAMHDEIARNGSWSP